VSDYEQVGEIHNAFLTNVKNNFIGSTEVISETEKVDFIKEFNKNFVSTLDLPSEHKNLLLHGFDEHKELVITSKLVYKSFGCGPMKSEEAENEDINILIETLYANELICRHSFDLLTRLLSYVKANYEKSISDEHLELNIQKLIAEFDRYGYDISSGEGEMVASILAISNSSINWWKANPDAFNNDLECNKALPVWAAADLVGAAWGGVTGAVSSYVSSGEVKWAAVGIGALSGGIAGSTGAIGKIVKWLK
jgi:hypothetical protein